MGGNRIILSTINARYVHAAFGLRYLWANMGTLQPQTVIREFTLRQTGIEIAEILLEEDPGIIGFGVYVWNVEKTAEAVQIIKGVRPDITVVVGGPEVSFEDEQTPLFEQADYVIRGEADEAFRELAQGLLAGQAPPGKVIDAPRPDVATLALPYEAYTEEDLSRRIMYVETSRGCPFGCEFCLSSLDRKVRVFPLEDVLTAIAGMIAKGARRFKFVDRTFNLDGQRVDEVLTFLQKHWCAGMQVHFEVVPDRLTPAMLERMAEFPEHGLRLEVGVQSFNPEVQAAISRRQDMDKTVESIGHLVERTGALVHADLIVGLPGESWESFGQGFDRLLALRPAEIQVGILKRLKGAPIDRHTEPHAMVYEARPPYALLQNDLLDFGRMQRLKRFARYFELYHNSGNFPESLEFVWETAPSPFEAFMGLSDYLWAHVRRTHELPLREQVRQLQGYLLEKGLRSQEAIADVLERDYRRLPGRKDNLDFLRPKAG